MEKRERLGEFVYRWTGECFPLGRDSLLLGEFATLRRGDRVCDLGCGAGLLPLLLLGRERALALTGVELDPRAAELARENLAQNGLAGEILTGDYREIRALLPAGRFDLAISNPPYYAPGAGGDGGPARMGELAAVCGAAGWLLKNGGRFALVCRPARLGALFAALRGAGLEPKRLRLAQHGPDTPPFAALVEAVRQGREGLAVLPTLVEHP